MQRLALFLLLAITASMIFAFGTPVFAQETPEEPSGDEMVDEGMTEESMGDEMTDGSMTEESMGDEMAGEEMMEDTMVEEDVEIVDSPLKQMAAGVDPHQIQCKSGQKLVFKASNWRPSCINESSYDILAARGWVSSHDPTEDVLAKMMDDYMMAHPEEEPEVPEETPTDIEIEEDVTVEEETTAGNGTETEGESQPQSYEINLSEDMEMGAQ